MKDRPLSRASSIAARIGEEEADAGAGDVDHALRQEAQRVRWAARDRDDGLLAERIDRGLAPVEGGEMRDDAHGDALLLAERDDGTDERLGPVERKPEEHFVDRTFRAARRAAPADPRAAVAGPTCRCRWTFRCRSRERKDVRPHVQDLDHAVAETVALGESRGAVEGGAAVADDDHVTQVAAEASTWRATRAASGARRRDHKASREDHEEGRVHVLEPEGRLSGIRVGGDTTRPGSLNSRDAGDRRYEL